MDGKNEKYSNIINNLNYLFDYDVMYCEEMMRRLAKKSFKLESYGDVGNGKIVRAFVPLAEMFGYSTDLRSKTQGRGNYSMFFEKYEQVPKSVQEKVISAHGK